jgi:hypothetical protein
VLVPFRILVPDEILTVPGPAMFELLSSVNIISLLSLSDKSESVPYGRVSPIPDVPRVRVTVPDVVIGDTADVLLKLNVVLGLPEESLKFFTA